LLARAVPLTMMPVDFTTDRLARERFEREAKAVARLQHKNVVTIHELGEVDGAPFIVMEFLSGKDLDAILRSSRTLSLVEKIDIAIQLCEGLGYAHEQGIVHRDIKPGNVRVLEDGTVKLLDFGIAKFAMSSMTQTGTVMGTPSYMAPEQIAGTPVDGRADLFSVGVLLYELLLGHKPFVGDSPTAIVYQIMHVDPKPISVEMPNLPDGLGTIVSRALQKDPKERYSRAAELAADLQMVKMSIDLPLRGDLPSSASATSMTLGRLHATMIGQTGKSPTGSGPTFDAPIRPGAATADTAEIPVATATKTKTISPMVLIAGAIGLLVVAGGAYFALAGKADGTPETTTSDATPSPSPSRGASGSTGAAASGGAATPAAAVTMAISSVPSGAAIVLNGTDLNRKTPADVPVEGAGSSTLQLTLRGYQPVTATLSAADLRAGRKEFRLAPEAGPVRLKMTGTYPFEIVQGSKVISSSASEHDVVVQPNGGAVSARNADLLLNMPATIEFQRRQADATVPAAATLSVYSRVETCNVVVDGQDLGVQPIIAKKIASGAHTVAIKCPDGREDSRKVTLTPGEKLSVNFAAPKG
jgi:hypothetical protein